MDTGLDRASATRLSLPLLRKGTLLRIRSGIGKGVAVFSGSAWITQHEDPRDVLLGAGESFVLDRPGLAIVQALDDTSMLVFDADPLEQSTAERETPWARA